MSAVEKLNRCAAILTEQTEQLQNGEVDSILSLEQEKDDLLRQIDWVSLKEDAEGLALAQTLLRQQQAFEQSCTQVRDGLMEQMSNVRKKQKALASYLSNR